jgi:hypothetical protein
VNVRLIDLPDQRRQIAELQTQVGVLQAALSALTQQVARLTLGALTNPHMTDAVVDSGGLTVTAGNMAINSAINVNRALTVRGTTADATRNALVLENSTPTALFLVRNDGLVTIATGPLALSAGAFTYTAPPAFVAGDKYLVRAASGEVHVSALGPAS